MGDYWYWQGRMSAAERATVYKCTVLSYDALHRPAGIFKQCASHLSSHEANVEQIFFLAGKLADPNLYGKNLTRFTRIHFNIGAPLTVHLWTQF